jgi:RNA recognition motif-containing protein
MSIKIYVGNLSFDSSEADLKGLFATYGEVVSAKVITDQFTGKSRGFAFIEMSDREEGLKAIQALDSKDLGGRSLKVNEAKPKTDSRGGGGGRGGGGYGEGRGGGGSRW